VSSATWEARTVPRFRTAQIITDRSEVARVYRCYWKVHPLRMAIIIGLRVWIEMLLNKRVVVRVQPDDPNPVAGLTDPADLAPENWTA